MAGGIQGCISSNQLSCGPTSQTQHMWFSVREALAGVATALVYQPQGFLNFTFQSDGFHWFVQRPAHLFIASSPWSKENGSVACSCFERDRVFISLKQPFIHQAFLIPQRRVQLHGLWKFSNGSRRTGSESLPNRLLNTIISHSRGIREGSDASDHKT